MRRNEKADSLPAGTAASPIGAKTRSPGIGRQARQRIGAHLRSMYDTVLQQPVPDRFADLIAKLSDAAPKPNSEGSR